ncbi:MAG: HDOD domain-containing protein [Burkholderiales bacterium]|nr:HDOD domain-containing protein [Burkholderiales bacterium]
MPAPNTSRHAADGAGATDAAGAAAAAVRVFGRLQLLRLLGKSRRTMAWLALEPDGAERMLVLPRLQPAERAALESWTAAVRRAARLEHPQLAPVLEIGMQGGWPFVLHDLRGRATLADRMPRDGMPGTEAAALAAQALRGLAYAHEAGISHGDIEPWLLLVSDAGQLQCAGLAAGTPAHEDDRELDTIDTRTLRQHRRAAERDVLALGVVLHHLLGGAPALDEPDVGRVVDRLPPLGRDFVRLSWSGARRVAEPLRAIVNRATDRQERQRYRNARTLLGALEGWLSTESAAGGGVLALLGDRLRAAGALPSAPGAPVRAARIAGAAGERTSDLAEVVLEDVALAFELLRTVNSTQARAAASAGHGPVLTVRRAIAMVGLEGVRRAALGLRPWPGPLADAGAAQLEQLLARCKRAGRIALALRPAGYDAEVVYLVTLMQALGRLVVQYHFPDEAQQIARLVQPGPAAREGEPEEPGMSDESAGCAVLGAGVEAIGIAVARGWGLDDTVCMLLRRLPLGAPVHGPANDDEVLRAVASCAHETVDALALPAPRVAPALQRVVQRYGRALGFAWRDLQSALQGGADEPISQPGLTMPAPLADPAPVAGRSRSASRLAS